MTELFLENAMAKHELSDSDGSSKHNAKSLNDTDVSDYIIDNSPLLIVRIKPDGTTLYANKAACRTSGYSLDEIVSRGWLNVNYPGDKKHQLGKMWAELKSSRDVVDYELTTTNKAGEDRIIRWHTANMFDENNHVVEIIGLGKDITEEKAKALEAKQTALRLAEAQRVAKIGSWEMDLVKNYLWWSEESYRIFGFLKEKNRAATFEQFMETILSEDRERVRTEYLLSIENKTPFEFNYRFSVPNHPIRHIHASGEHQFDAEGNAVRSVGTIRDITDEVVREQKLLAAQSEARELQAYNEYVVENSPIFIVGLAPSGEIKHINKTGCILSGYQSHELIGKNFWQVLFQDEHAAEVSKVRRLQLENKAIADHEIKIHCKDGQERIISWSAIDSPINTGSVSEIIGVGVDITDLKQSQQELEQLVHHDSLTGLPNRFNLSVRLEIAIEAAAKGKSTGALICIDLDRFKNINDSNGHSCGDELLKAVGNRLTHCMRHEDVVARLSGDEFAILIQDIGNPLNVNRVVDKIKSAFDARFMFDAHEFDLRASIGVSLFPRDGATVEELFKNADIAMHNAKELGGNIEAFYTPELNDTTTRRIWIEKNLRNALEKHELQLYYQPQVSLIDGRLVGAESLLRWIHPEEGFISPGEFIPIAEDTGLIIEIGDWVLRQACQQAKSWLSSGLDVGHLAVNIAGPQITRGNLLSSCKQALKESGIPHSMIELEVTEGFIMNDSENSIDVLYQLRDLGVPMSIDDFGTGYSSLSYLKQLPIGRIKVDQSFVRGIPEDKDDVAITKSIVSLGQNLGLNVIAEGVETAEQRDFLLDIGCEFGQGYFYYKPMPASDFFDEFKSSRDSSGGEQSRSSAAY